MFIILYNEPTNAQLFHKLSHSYMFRHYRVIRKKIVINTLPSYTSISSAAVGNKIYTYDIRVLFIHQLMHQWVVLKNNIKIYIKTFYNCNFNKHKLMRSLMMV